MYFIYKITSKKTNKYYIGITNNFNKRSEQHFRKLNNNCHENSYLQNHHTKYNDLLIEQIDECNNKEEALLKEKYYINLFESYKRDKGFNLTLGGEYPSCSNEAKKKYWRNAAKSIFVYTITGEFLGEFPSLIDAAEHFNLNRYSIANAVSRGIRLKNFMFFRKKKRFKLYKAASNCARKILVFKKDFSYFKSFKSMMNASRYFKISNNTINTHCNRLSISKDKYYFIRDTQLNTFKEKYNI